MGSLDLTDPTAVLLAVTDALTQAGIRSATYGGLALAAYGEPRETKDADLAVLAVTGAMAHAAFRHADLAHSLTFENVIFGGLTITRLALLPATGGSSVNTADLVQPRSARYASLALDRALSGELRGRAVRVLAPEDFVLFKVLSTRARDIEDATTVLASLGDRIDRALIRAEAERLAGELPDHDVMGRLTLVTAP
jgi:hypothetical protein